MPEVKIENPVKTPGSDKININYFFSSSKERFLIVFSTNIINILIFVLLGFLLDKFFNTKPLFLVLAIIISLPVGIYFMVSKSKKLIDNVIKKDA